ncbi:sphingosine N-acyltransferase LAG1 [Achaetomium macrosporum]|uniref:Sphingosine N-acyltransferase LAG1 n=1 Tax=Achaetomium macrosporum TaxID=79813 RepID=A0AAN7HB70_9PEZI|nr:sphingosine N-acyltransferase LAG1 [Achaetomium macrosporum]
MAASKTCSLLSTSANPLQVTADHHHDGSPRRRAKSNSLSRRPFPLSSSHAHPSRPANQSKSSARRRKGSGRSLRWLFRRTWTLPLALILGFLSLYAIIPTESNPVHPFLFLSYRINHQDGQYGKGPRDLAFISFYTIVLSFTREFVMQEVLRPLARLGGIRSRGKQQRFMEQMYTACYIAFIGPLGLYTMKQTPGLWYFETRAMYEGFPHRTHQAVFKFYYLFQAAFWVQQAIVMLLGQEKRRKDFRELVAHHIITIALIALSYRFHFTYIGIAVYITHDISDFFLAISKSLNYLTSPLQAPAFALCIAAWVYLRHYLNLRILASVATEFRTVGPFELDWVAGQYKCGISQAVTFALLAALQALNLFWLYCLFRSAYRFVVLGVAKDDRSEAEEEDDDGVGEGAKRAKKALLDGSNIRVVVTEFS